MLSAAGIDEPGLARFARVTAPLFRGAAAEGSGTRAARDRAGAGLEFLDLQPYRPGDDLRHVDWRQSGRLGRPVVRRYRDESASDWLVLVDGSASMRRGRKWQLAAAVAVAMTYTLLHAGHRSGLGVFSDSVHAWSPPGRGQRHFAGIARQLLRYRPPEHGGASFPGLCAGRLKRTSNLLLLSDFLRSDAMSADLRRLAAVTASGSAIQILAMDEVPGRAIGPALLSDVESGDAQKSTLTTATLGAAERALAAHNDRVRRLCATLSLRFSSASDEDDWEMVLLRHLGASR